MGLQTMPDVKNMTTRLAARFQHIAHHLSEQGFRSQHGLRIQVTLHTDIEAQILD